MAKARFTDQVALVTGGTSGLGLATAELFLNESAKVFLVDLEERGIIAKFGSEKAAFHRCDVSSSEECTKAVAACIDRFGRLDILFHNAGVVSSFATVVDHTIEEFQKVTNTNLLSLFYFSRAAIPQMRKRGGGNIIVTASVAGMNGQYGLAPYTTSKAGVINLVRTMALDHAREGIRVNCVCPGYMLTPMVAFVKEQANIHQDLVDAIPIGRGAHPAEVGRVVLFLASDEASYVTGQGPYSVFLNDGSLRLELTCSRGKAIAVDGGMNSCNSPINFKRYNGT
jgi:meso-butanediol dehydrogenase/(S,S)-butanediol dehydrogenase/diacetyl reductase